MELDAGRRRASRRVRVNGRGARLRERDLDVLLALAKMRLLRTSHLARLFFSAKGTCQKRARKLFDAGLIRAVVTDLASENRYALTRLGHDLLVEALDEVAVPPFRPAPRVDGRSLVHLDLLNGYRIALALGAPKEGFELLAFLPDWELRAKDPHATLVPDAVVALGRNDHLTGNLVFALEVDTGAEAASLVLRKLERYRERHALRQQVFGFSLDAVLLLTKSERRARTLARHVVQSGSQGASPLVLLAAEKTVSDGGGVACGLALPKDLVATGEVGVGTFGRGFVRMTA